MAGFGFFGFKEIANSDFELVPWFRVLPARESKNKSLVCCLLWNS
jgi:hypothetical protein